MFEGQVIVRVEFGLIDGRDIDEDRVLAEFGIHESLDIGTMVEFVFKLDVLIFEDEGVRSIATAQSVKTIAAVQGVITATNENVVTIIPGKHIVLPGPDTPSML